MTWPEASRHCLELDDVIGPAETEGIDLQAPGPILGLRPVGRLVGNMEARRLKIDLGIGRSVVRGGREYARLHGGDAPDETVETGSAEGVADLGLEGGEHRPVGGWKKGLEGLDLLDVALNRAGGMAFHQVHQIGAVAGILEGCPNGDHLGFGQRLHHTPIVVARADSGNVGVNGGPPPFGHRFPFDDDHAPAFAEDHAVAGGVKGPAALLRRPFDARQPGQGLEGGEFQVMGGLQRLFPAAHHRGIDNAVLDHLDRTVEGHQAGGAGSRDRVARALEAVLVADKAAGRAIEPAQEGGVVDGQTARPDLLPDSRFQFRRHGDEIPHGLDDLVGVHVKDQVRDRGGRLPRVLGNEHADAFPGDAGIQKARIPDGLFCQPEGQLGGIGHGTEVLGRDVQIPCGRCRYSETRPRCSRSCSGRGDRDHSTGRGPTVNGAPR